MSSATAKPASPPPADPLAAQVDAMVSDAAAHAASSSTLDSSVAAAIKASAPSTANPQSLDDQLAQTAHAAIDDEFADPNAFEPPAAPLAPAPAPPPPTAAATPPPAKPAVASATSTAPKPTTPAPAPATTAKPSVAAAAAASTTPSSTPAEAAPPRAPGRLKPALASLLNSISKPLEPIALKLGKLSPSARQTISWVALLTFFHASIVWGYALLKSPTNFGHPRTHQPSLNPEGTHEELEPEPPAPTPAADDKAHGSAAPAEHGAPPADAHAAPPAKGGH